MDQTITTIRDAERIINSWTERYLVQPTDEQKRKAARLLVEYIGGYGKVLDDTLIESFDLEAAFKGKQQKRKITVCRFGPNPEVAFEKGHRLAGFDDEGLGMGDYSSARAARLYKALGTANDDEEMVLGTLPGGRWAMIGLTVDGHEYAVEEN
jgi:hypothetical protein